MSAGGARFVVSGLKASGTFQVPRIEIRYGVFWFVGVEIGSWKLPPPPSDPWSRRCVPLQVGGDPQMSGDWLDLANAQYCVDNGRHSTGEMYGIDAAALRAFCLQPSGEVFVGEDVAAELVVGR